MRSPTRSRRLGQHFLSDRNILDKIVDALDPAPDDVVLEIGAGKGTLTERLLARGLRVIAIEKDRRLAHQCGVRNAQWGVDRLTVVQGDALRVDWHALVTPHLARRTPHFTIVGNIPYAITTPLIDKALTAPLPERVVFLVQREVADRLAAAPGAPAYGGLSVGVQAVCRVERLFTVGAGAFVPPPRVASAVVRLTPRTPALVTADELAPFRAFVTACFGRRRKQLRNVLRGVTDRPAPVVAAGLAELGVDPAARPETLTPETFVRLLRWESRL